jgi:hypothetical protein
VAPSNPTRKKENTLPTTIAEPRLCSALIGLLLLAPGCWLQGGPDLESPATPVFTTQGNGGARPGHGGLFILAGRLRS